MNVFVINLDKDKDRLSFMDEQLSSINLSYTRIPGKVPNEHDKVDLYDREFVSLNYKNQFRNWEIWCALSHYDIYKTIVENDIKKSIIFEDDVQIDKNGFLNSIEILSKNDNWEYVSMNYDTFDKKFRDKYLWYRPIELIQQYYWRLFGPVLFPIIRPLHLAWCYAITVEWARKILSTHWQKIRYLADYVQNEAKKQHWLKIKFIAPQLTQQANEKFISNTRN